MNGIDWDLVRSSLGPLFDGLVTGTIPLTAVSFVLGLALAVLLALMLIPLGGPQALLPTLLDTVVGPLVALVTGGQ